MKDDRGRKDEPPTYKDAIEKRNDDERRGSYDDRRYSDDDKGRDETSRYTTVERNYKTTVDQYTDVNEFLVVSRRLLYVLLRRWKRRHN